MRGLYLKILGFVVLLQMAKVAMVLASGGDPNATTIAQQAIIDDAKDNGTISALDDGDLAINVGLVVPNQSGGVILGTGASELLAYEHPLSGASTRLIASGEDREDLDLLTINGAETAIRDLSLYGYTRAEAEAEAARAKCGIMITKDGEGLGTGGVSIDNAFIIGFQTGIQAAVGVTENNCERCAFRKVRFQRNDAGLKITSQQSMGFGLSDCEWYDNLDCIRVEGGGKIVVTNAFVHSPDDEIDRAFLRFAPRDYVLSIGPNNGMYYIAGLYADRSAPNLKLISMRQKDDGNVIVPYYITTTFIGFHIALATYTEPAVKVCGNSNTTLRDGYGVRSDWVTWENEPSGGSKMTSRVVIDNCQLYDCDTGDDVADLASARGDCHLIVKNCYNQFNVAIPDYDETLIGDLP
jgi:hypothetical protein